MFEEFVTRRTYFLSIKSAGILGNGGRLSTEKVNKANSAIPLAKWL